MTLAQERMHTEYTISPDFRNEVNLMGPPCSGSCSENSCLLLQAFLRACLLSAAMYTIQSVDCRPVLACQVCVTCPQ